MQIIPASSNPKIFFSRPHTTFIQIIQDDDGDWATVKGDFDRTQNKWKLDLYHSAKVKVGSRSALSKKVMDSCKSLAFEEFVLQAKNVTQTVEVGCGFFAIAYAEVLARGENPRCLEFDTIQMSKHLWTCFEDKQIKAFPLNIQKSQTKGSSV